MRTKRNLILICLLGAVLLPAVVQAQYSYYINYPDNNSVTITRYTGSDVNLTIPNTIDGLPVTSIVNSGSFLCTSLTNVFIGSNVTNIQDDIFSKCTNLITITVDTNNPAYSSVAGVLFDKNQTTLFAYPAGKVGSYAVPTNVTSIGYNSFFKSPNLTSVTIPDGVTTIGDSAFSGCPNLTNVTLGANVTSIGDYVFVSCYNLNSITVNAANPAYSCVDEVLLNKNQTKLIECLWVKAGSYAIPNGVTSIADYAFEVCPNLTSVSIPSSVTNIGYAAFAICSSLNAITADAQNSGYADVDGVLFNKSLATLIAYPGGRPGGYIIPNSVTSIGDWAFGANFGVTNITIGNSVTSIGNEAFINCQNLTSITIGKNVAFVGDEALAACPYLTSIYFVIKYPDYISSSAFLSWLNINFYLLEQPQFETNRTSLGVQTNQFGFNINWASGQTVVVDACTNLFNPVWQSVQTNTLTSASFYFSDPQWTNYSSRFYRLRSP